MTNQSASLSTDSDDIARTATASAGDGESIPVSQRASQLAMEWFGHPAHNDVETFLARLPITIGSKPIDDPYAEWHPNTTDFGAMSRAHLLRIYHGWKHETALHSYLADEPQLVSEIGFDSLPGQSALYKAWHKRFSEEYRDELTQTVETVIEIARDNGVNVPDHAFRPEEKQDKELSARAQRRHACRTAKDVWQAAKPLVGPVVDFDRPDDTEIHDNAFIEMHTFLGCRADLYAETGAVDFFEETTRERTPTGSYHRNCIRSVEVEQHRENHRRAMKNVIARAKQAGDFSEPAITAIDITEGDLFQGERDTKKLKEQIIGTKENNREVAYQYATIQVVGNDLPIVLDSIPVTKGMPRAMIVHELLRYSTDMLQIDLVLMDREFDGEAVKDACDHNTVYYFSPKRMFDKQKETAKQLRQEGTLVHVETTETAADRPPRRRLWVPKKNTDSDEMIPDGDTTAAENSAADEDEDDEKEAVCEYREQLEREFLETFGDNLDEDVVDWALGSKLLDNDSDDSDDSDDGDESESNDTDDEEEVLHMVFETNHPSLTVTDEDGDRYDEQTLLHMVARLTNLYSYRWDIENGYKKVKSFMAETTSTDLRYRFFNFSFACVLYSLWRLIDLVVTLSLGEDPDDARQVRASTFLTIAKQYYGLDPPD